MTIHSIDLVKVNQQLKESSPEAIIAWALSLNQPTILSSSFGYYSAVSLHMLVNTPGGADIPVVWVDSGYNVKDAYQVADQLTRELDLNLKVFNPLMSSERRTALFGAIPGHDEPGFSDFVEQVKLEPFSRALNALKPKIWLSGIRQEETEHRQNLDVVVMDERGIIKVSPLFYWQENDLARYLTEHQLPNCKHYFDPTKVRENMECGLHTFAKTTKP